jgi:light-regulated signal transduction histidine kinase (bacteriophytochrome)
MANLVKEMLTFSSVQQSPKTLVEIKMNELVELVLNQIDNIVQEKKAEITWTALPNAYGESLLVFQLMQNLIINGIKYQPENNTPKITISGSPKGQFIEYIVTDNGIGMSNDTLLKIFDPLYREHKHEYGDGTGMGLSNL